MSWWIYKCNSQNRDYQRSWGDWKEFFDGDSDEDWGSTQWVPELSKLKEGDMVIAYQTNRNELVGLAKVRQSWMGRSYRTAAEGITQFVADFLQNAVIDRVWQIRNENLNAYLLG